MKSLRMAIGFGNLWKSEKELMDTTGLNLAEFETELSKISSSVTTKCDDGVYFYAMTARIAK